MKKINPICFANGDETTALVAQAVREVLFPHIPMEEVDVSVESRLDTNDDCLRQAADSFKRCGSGLKISTASDDPRIKESNMGSANIQLRSLTGAFGMLRKTLAGGNYQNPVAILRYAHGDFYDEQNCIEQCIDGRRIAVVTTHMDVEDIEPFAELVCKVARTLDFPIIVSSKWTIAESEKQFHNEVVRYIRGRGFECRSELTDVAIAKIAVDKVGGWLRVFSNANGDTAADVADFVHGNHVMSSTVHCREGFSYEELPGGTAPDKMNIDLQSVNFFNPLTTILGFTSAIKAVNPDMSVFCQIVRDFSLFYLEHTVSDKWNTHDMLYFVERMLGDRSPAGLKRRSWYNK